MNQPDQEVQDGNMAGKLINVLTFELGEYHPHQLFIQGFTRFCPQSFYPWQTLPNELKEHDDLDT